MPFFNGEFESCQFLSCKRYCGTKINIRSENSGCMCHFAIKLSADQPEKQKHKKIISGKVAITKTNQKIRTEEHFHIRGRKVGDAHS